MAILHSVTITGADDDTHLLALANLSKRFYNWVEWGILVSEARFGTPRFPSLDWIALLQRTADLFPQMRLSLHLCGRWLRQLLLGNVNWQLRQLCRGFQRMQLNFHGEPLEYDRTGFVHALNDLGVKNIIFQIDGAQGQELLAAVDDGKQSFACWPLFDLSHGAGVSPEKWPKPLNESCYSGYAGGLGPDNLAVEILRILAAAGDATVWIDMETKVRSNNDSLFDLGKVERCLELARPFVEGK